MIPPQISDADGARTLTAEEIHDLLSARYRRYTLYGLSVFTPPVTLARVAEFVTEWEFGVAAGDLPDERLEIYMVLYHDHLPYLVDAGVIRYNQEPDTLEPGPNTAQLQSELSNQMAQELAERHQQLFPGL